ncbi:CLUMA_CG015841, isoform A [Clunio marinus]|uniref:Metalloendopeptidase n=1 Tax=Clunio marinus TaxID=568069 RepID=A0A1J1IVP8_9DIPT|nr:CLUMA_CG015841, isoform A [Clunio marinus]
MKSNFKIISLVILLAIFAQIIAKPARKAKRDDNSLDAEIREQILPPADGVNSLEITSKNVKKELENGGLFQGDIKLLNEQKEFLSPSPGNFISRTGLLNEYYRWPKDKKGHVIVPYYIDGGSSYSENDKKIIRYAMNDLEKYTCVRFREWNSDEDFIMIYDGYDGCWSHMGRIGKQQEVGLQKNGCIHRGTIIHELIHTLGYDHMHSHVDRDDYVEIIYDNIKKNDISNFDKVDPELFSNFNTSYDLYSVMHYDKKAFSKNGKATIVPKDSRFRDFIGQRTGLSKGDVTRINNMYQCSNRHLPESWTILKKRAMFSKLKSFFFVLNLILSLTLQVKAKPFDDKIVFRDDDDDLSLLNLESSNQLLQSVDDLRALNTEGEIVQKESEEGEHFQGDIKLLPEQKEFLLANESDGSLPTRTGLTNEYFRWPKDRNGFVVVPYVISPKSQYTNYQKQLIRYSMNDIERYTCIRFIESSKSYKDYIVIYDDGGCYSNLGKIGGAQELSLKKNGCFSRGTIIHELIHALGYDHMHCHSDRDRFVEIRWDNIKNGRADNFYKVDSKRFSNFNTGYDLFSVMHYDMKAFSKNGKETIVPRNRRFRNIMGQRKGMSIGDAQRVNNMYRCRF